MAEAAFLIAMMLGRPPGLVYTVYDMAGLSGVCVVEAESQFNEHAWCREARGGTSYGLFQLYDKYQANLLSLCREHHAEAHKEAVMLWAWLVGVAVVVLMVLVFFRKRKVHSACDMANVFEDEKEEKDV
jgi:uncharacterized membrane protein YuzA (DUF378 family)